MCIRDGRTVDDNPFGGGAGMVMRPDIVDATLRELRAEAPQLPLIYLSPRGKMLNQKRCRELAAGPGAIRLVGCVEGTDQSVLRLLCTTVAAIVLTAVH